MRPIKTREEIYREYTREINRLKHEINDLECDMDLAQGKIAAHNRRIKQLEDTAKIFLPKGEVPS